MSGRRSRGRPLPGNPYHHCGGEIGKEGESQPTQDFHVALVGYEDLQARTEQKSDPLMLQWEAASTRVARPEADRRGKLDRIMVLGRRDIGRVDLRGRAVQ